MLSNMDHTFRLELAWLSSNAEEQLQQAVHRRILGCLPTAQVGLTFSQSLRRLDDFIGSDMGKMMSRSSQAEASTARAVVEKLRTGTYVPDATLANAGGVYSKLYTMLEFFCRAPKAGQGSDGSELVGKPALEANMQTLQGKLSKKGRHPTLQEIDSLKPFAYLMDDIQHKLLAAWSQEALAGLAQGASATSASISAGSSSDSAGKAGFKAKPSVLSFFG
jgi:hypothetical protein